MSREFTLLLLAGLLAASIAIIGYAVTSNEPREQFGQTINMPLDAH
jgi:uncharacterized protein (UPF0333 family)